MTDEAIQIVTANLAGNTAHRRAVEELLEAYAQDAMGLGGSLPAGRASESAAGLMRLASGRVFLAHNQAGEYVGMAVCFITYSTFSGCRAMNVHDLIVRKEWRGRGIAERLMRYAMEHARGHESAGKVTLEVRSDNVAAKALYRRLGFGPGSAPYEFWTCDVR